MSQNNKHTPLLWETGKGYYKGGRHFWVDVTTKHKKTNQNVLICSCPSHNYNMPDDITPLEAEENAALIVTAVNNHYSLLEALKAAQLSLETLSGYNSFSTRDKHRQALNKCSAAIKNAENNNQ